MKQWFNTWYFLITDRQQLDLHRSLTFYLHTSDSFKGSFPNILVYKHMECNTVFFGFAPNLKNIERTCYIVLYNLLWFSMILFYTILLFHYSFLISLYILMLTVTDITINTNLLHLQFHFKIVNHSSLENNNVYMLLVLILDLKWLFELLNSFQRRWRYFLLYSDNITFTEQGPVHQVDLPSFLWRFILWYHV